MRQGDLIYLSGWYIVTRGRALMWPMIEAAPNFIADGF